MKTKQLNLFQRALACFLYISIFIFACRLFSGSWNFLFDPESVYNVIFISGALLLVLGAYIAEPFFTKPTDVLANSVAVILALLSINEKNSFIGYWYLMIASGIMLVISVTLFLLYNYPKTRKAQKITTEILTKFGQSKIVFSVIYITTLFSFFYDKPIDFAFFITFWAIFISNFLVDSFVIWISKIIKMAKVQDKGLLGEAIGCENPFLYKVEVDYFKNHARDTKKGELVYLSTENTCGYVGIIIDEKYLLNKKWITIYLLQEDNLPIKINLKNNEIVEGSRSIFSADNNVYSLDLDSIENTDSRDKISNNSLYKNRNNFVGYVSKGSNINKVKFTTLVDQSNPSNKLLQEGSVIKTDIKGSSVLYQIIDGETIEEELDKHNIHGYLSGIAHKLGIYIKSKYELDVAKWLPNIYSPIYFDDTRILDQNSLTVGCLPETNLQITLKDVHSLVTHNTAILGILGIGKSCLTFELIKKTIENTASKVVCIDITGEYREELTSYALNPKDINEIDPNLSTELEQNYLSINKDVMKGGNHADFKRKITDILTNFIAGDEKLLVINPEDFNVSKQTNDVKPKKVGPGPSDWQDQAPMADLSLAEKTRIISESLLEVCKSLGKTTEARCLIVFEEAHSLVPEWNSIANKGDENASNGTAKVVLQGRKYGLGCFVVTQRTANISKSILNQCNTIFALRVFDDTGKQFLENYIGYDYANILPTLAERHAIAVGKALKLKQPVVVKLNEKLDVVSSAQAG